MKRDKGISIPIAILLVITCFAVAGVLIWQFASFEEEPTTKQPSDYTTQSACGEAGYYWYDKNCYEQPQSPTSGVGELKTYEWPDYSRCTAEGFYRLTTEQGWSVVYSQTVDLSEYVGQKVKWAGSRERAGHECTRTCPCGIILTSVQLAKDNVPRD